MTLQTATTSKSENRRTTLRERLTTLSKTNDEAAVRKIMHDYLESRSVFDDQAEFEEVFDVWFRQSYRKPVSPGVRESRVSSQGTIRTSLRQQTEQREHIVRVEAQVDLMEEMLANGKPIAECTAKQIVEYGETGSAYLKRVAALARKQHPRTLGKTFLTRELLTEMFNTAGHFNNPRKK